MLFLFQKRISNHDKCCHYDMHSVTIFERLLYALVFNAIQFIQQVFNKQQNFGSLNATDLVVLNIISSPELKAQVNLSVNFYIFDFFSRTTRPILTRFGTNHPLGKWIHVFSNEEQHSSLRGDNNKRVTGCVMTHKCTKFHRWPSSKSNVKVSKFTVPI